jgi:hypothetical protein
VRRRKNPQKNAIMHYMMQPMVNLEKSQDLSPSQIWMKECHMIITEKTELEQLEKGQEASNSLLPPVKGQRIAHEQIHADDASLRDFLASPVV